MFIEPPLTQDFIARSIGVSRENISREFRKLEREGLVGLQEKHLVILNSKK